MATFKERLEEAMQLRNIRPADLSKLTGIGEGAISQYRKGSYKASQRNLEKISRALSVSIPWLMGVDAPVPPASIPPGLQPMPNTVKRPLVGQIACGTPILAEQNIENYVDVPEDINCDFVLTCRGDSMIGAGISDGDQVYIRVQPEVENGQIAAVLIGDETTLKRVYWDGETLLLMPANSAYAPKSYTGSALNEIHIEGLAVGYTHLFKH